MTKSKCQIKSKTSMSKLMNLWTAAVTSNVPPLDISKPCSFHQLTLSPWPRRGFPPPLRRNSWHTIQCDRFKNAYQVALPDPVPVSGRGGQAWTMELWTWVIYFLAFVIWHSFEIWALIFVIRIFLFTYLGPFRITIQATHFRGGSWLTAWKIYISRALQLIFHD